MSNRTGKAAGGEVSQGRGQWLLGALVVVCLAGAAWSLWGPTKPDGAGKTTIVPKVMCSSCGFVADVGQVELEGEAARVPAMGPGYKCPKCGNRTLYPNPYICKQCKTPFLLSKDASGNTRPSVPSVGRRIDVTVSGRPPPSLAASHFEGCDCAAFSSSIRFSSLAHLGPPRSGRAFVAGELTGRSG